jgi:hypothetical protein
LTQQILIIFGINFENPGRQNGPPMKQTILLALLALITGATSAQKSNLIFFAENGEKFTVIMNGLRYNEVPATNVKLTDLTAPATYKVKVLFEDASLGEVTKTIPLDPFKEYTFNIRPKKETAVGGAFKKAGNQVARDLGGRDSSDIKKKEEDKEKYVMRFISETPLMVPMQQTTVVAPPPQPVYTPVPPAGTVTQTTRTTTTTTAVPATTTTTVVAPAAGMNVSVNDPDLGVNFNMNVGVPVGGVVTTGGTVQQTTTVTTTGTPMPVQQQPAHFVMPGYNGPIGCPWPMDQGTFNNALNTINNQAFEENKLQVAQQVFTSNCMTSAQVTQILGLFSFEDSKLDFAKFAYGRTFDLGNYFMVNNAFTFSSSVDELNAFIASQPRR